MSKKALKRVRKALGLEVCREPLPSFAWPGGYQMYYVATDGGSLCPGCANKEIDNIDDSMRRGIKDGWALEAADVNYEDDLTCDHCGEPIPASYAE